MRTSNPLMSRSSARKCTGVSQVMVVSNKLTNRASRAIGRTREASAKTDEVCVERVQGYRACR